MNNQLLSGLIAAPYTPMDDKGNIKPESIRPYADKLFNDGVSGAFICGTTGEGVSLTTGEKKRVMQEWVLHSKGKLKIIAHVGGLCLPQSIELAEFAAMNGVDAISAMAPSFFKPGSVDDLLLFLEPIAAAAPNLPFYYYHIPSMTGFFQPVNEMLVEAKKRIPNFAGVKFTHSDMMDLQQCLAIGNDSLEIFFGSDEMLICGLGFGLNSAVGSTYNFMPSVYLDLIEAYNNDDMETARELQQISVKIVEILIKHGGPVRAGKAIMDLIGIDCGPCRLPISKMTESEKKSLCKDLISVDFFKKIDHDLVNK